MDINNIYKIYIYEKYIELKNSGKILDNNDLCKIFEWLSCIKLSEEHDKIFYEYSDIDPTFKENNMMTKNDTGIDCCDMIDTIVQCKLRKDTLTWKDCSTFFGSMNIFDEKTNEIIVRWKKLIITRNEECKLSNNLLQRSKLFIDKPFSRHYIIDYCENLLSNPPKYPKNKNNNFKLRDYQIEAIDIIKKNNNVIISLPTGCGKNIVIIHSLETEHNKKYLILVPRIILMEQIMDEIIQYKPELKNKIQCIGDNNNVYDINKNITICVYNSIVILEPYFESYDKIYIDEAHHIVKPMIYDIEDDIEISGYNHMIKSLTKYNNNIYLSATIDIINDFTYYKKDIRDMIDCKYLCDYNINIPIFNNDITNMNICEHLIANYRNIIIYCNTQKEGKNINNIMNNIMKDCSEYIDCMTPKSKRNKIIKKYKEGNISFLVNVRILVEGFDAPITKGICFIHLPSNKTTIIQIIGRSLRLHNLKTISHIILPFSCKEDESNINNFLRIIATNDKRIKQSYENKKIGGYISIENIIENEENNIIELRYDSIYNNMNKIIDYEKIWLEYLIKVKNYIDSHNIRPSEVSKNKNIKFLGKWVQRQNYNYKYKLQIMANYKIYNEWTKFINSEYKKYFVSSEEYWIETLEKVKNYIDSYNIRPSEVSKNKNIKFLGKWIQRQNNNYKYKIQIMSNYKIYDKWTQFINIDYIKFFV
jgi:superfamily II DNA or RNA helicase